MYACRTCCTFTMDGCPSWIEMAKKQKLHASGHRQREQSVEYAEAPFSHLARYLLEEFAFGGISANQVQKLAWMAKRDGLHHSFVDKFASKKIPILLIAKGLMFLVRRRDMSYRLRVPTEAQPLQKALRLFSASRQHNTI